MPSKNHDLGTVCTVVSSLLIKFLLYATLSIGPQQAKATSLHNCMYFLFRSFFPNNLTVVTTTQSSYVADLCAEVPPKQVFIQVGNICSGHTSIYIHILTVKNYFEENPISVIFHSFLLSSSFPLTFYLSTSV